MPRKPKFGPGFWTPINELSAPKVLQFRGRYGLKGLGLYWLIKQFIRQASGTYELSEADLWGVAYDCREMTQDEIKEVIAVMLEIGILERTESGGFTEPNVKKCGIYSDEQSERGRDAVTIRHERDRTQKQAAAESDFPTLPSPSNDRSQSNSNGTDVVHPYYERTTDVVRTKYGCSTDEVRARYEGKTTDQERDQKGYASSEDPAGNQYERGTPVLSEDSGSKDPKSESLIKSGGEKERERNGTPVLRKGESVVRLPNTIQYNSFSSDLKDRDPKGGAGGEEQNVLQPQHSPPLESSPAVSTSEPAAAPEPKSPDRQEPQPAAAAAEPAAAVPVLLWFFQLTLENQKIVRGKFEDLARTVGRDDEETQKLAGELLKKGDQKFVLWWPTKRGTRPVTLEDYFSAMTGWVVDEVMPDVLRKKIELESSFEKSPEYRQERRTQYDRARNYARSRGKARDEIFLKLNFAGWRTLLELTEEKLKQTDSRIEDSLLKDFNDQYQKQRRLHGVGRAPKEEQKKKEQKKEEPKKETLTPEQVEQTPIDEATFSIDCLGSDEDRVKVEACLKRLDLTREEGEAEFRHYWEQRYLGGPTVRTPTPRELLDFMTKEIFTQDKFGLLQKKKKQKKIETQLAH